ncbi:hypothetical protein AAGG52_12845 [Bacillus licheniformis]
MFPDVEDMSLDVAKYYHENECFEMSSLYFLKVEEARKQTQRGIVCMKLKFKALTTSLAVTAALLSIGFMNVVSSSYHIAERLMV